MIPFKTQYTSHDNSFCILGSDENELSANIVPTKNLASRSQEPFEIGMSQWGGGRKMGSLSETSEDNVLL